jgi:hypothetical protein
VVKLNEILPKYYIMKALGESGGKTPRISDLQGKSPSTNWTGSLVVLRVGLDETANKISYPSLESARKIAFLTEIPQTWIFC